MLRTWRKAKAERVQVNAVDFRVMQAFANSLIEEFERLEN